MNTGRFLAGIASLGLLMTLIAAAPAAAQGSADCTLTVAPRNGGPGTEYTFSGTGYSPTRIVLKRPGTPPKTVEVTPSDTDGFSLRLIAGQGDIGTWKATAIEPEVCRASASFAVELPPTATIDPSDDGFRSAALAGFAGLGALFVLSSVVLLPRLARSARSR